jgi:SAM-dependent methyltransferase
MKAHAWCFPHGYDNRWERMAKVLRYSASRVGLDVEIHMMDKPEGMATDPKVASNHGKLKLWNQAVQDATEPIILLDADMYCQRNPAELPKIVEHVGITWRPEGQEVPVNGGFVFVQPTQEAKAFFQEWVEADDLLRSNPGLHMKYRQKWAGMNQSSLGHLIETSNPPLTRLECLDYNLVEPWNGIDGAAFVHCKSKLQYHIFSNTRENTDQMREAKRRFLSLEAEMHTTITPEYAALNEELHKSFARYGSNSERHLQRVLDLLREVGGQCVLDYGCGKGALVKALIEKEIPVQGYDPAMEEYKCRPEPADVLICTDVLEHIEPECLDAVLDDIKALTRKSAFLLIALRHDSTKLLPDGTNPHKIVRELHWWVSKLRKVFGHDNVRVKAHRPYHHAIVLLKIDP